MLKQAALEAIFIVFGVVLALGANEWRESLARDAQAYGARQSILQELRNNRALVEEAMAYHQGRLKILEEARKDGRPLSLRDFDRGFIAPAKLSDASWLTASRTGTLSDLPYEKVLTWGRLYELQDAYARRSDTVSEIIYADLFRSGTDAIISNPRGIAMLASTFAYQERELIDAYGQILSAGAAD